MSNLLDFLVLQVISGLRESLKAERCSNYDDKEWDTKESRIPFQCGLKWRRFERFRREHVGLQLRSSRDSDGKPEP